MEGQDEEGGVGGGGGVFTLSGEAMMAEIQVLASLVASAEPLIRMVRSPWPLDCFSTSIWAPESSLGWGGEGEAREDEEEGRRRR